MGTPLTKCTTLPVDPYDTNTRMTPYPFNKNENKKSFRNQKKKYDNNLSSKIITDPSIVFNQPKTSSVSPANSQSDLNAKQLLSIEDIAINLSNPPQLIRGYPKPLHYYNKHQNKHYLVITTSHHHFTSNNVQTVQSRNSYKHHLQSVRNDERIHISNIKNTDMNIKNNKIVTKMDKITNSVNKCTSKCTAGCVYMYDIQQNIYINFSSYPSNMKVENHGHCIDIKNDILYIFFGRHRIFAALNLITGILYILYIFYNKKDNKLIQIVYVFC